jgi:hypothetical protein
LKAGSCHGSLHSACSACGAKIRQPRRQFEKLGCWFPIDGQGHRGHGNRFNSSPGQWTLISRATYQPWTVASGHDDAPHGQRSYIYWQPVSIE